MDVDRRGRRHRGFRSMGQGGTRGRQRMWPWLITRAVGAKLDPACGGRAGSPVALVGSCRLPRLGQRRLGELRLGLISGSTTTQRAGDPPEVEVPTEVAHARRGPKLRLEAHGVRHDPCPIIDRLPAQILPTEAPTMSLLGVSPHGRDPVSYT